MTNLDPIVRALREQLPELEILEYEPMRAHCSFRIGGPARALVRPASAEETAAVCRIVRDGGAQPLIIGNGTNLLVTDGEVHRIVVQLEPWEDGKAYDRLGLTTEYCEILNVRVPCVTIPVGRAQPRGHPRARRHEQPPEGHGLQRGTGARDRARPQHRPRHLVLTRKGTGI